MSYEDYYDIFILAQQNKEAPYYMVAFDVVGSKNVPVEDILPLRQKISYILITVYRKLEDYEKETGKQVLIKDSRFFPPWSKEARETVDHNYMDPDIIGDCFLFTVLRDTITKEQIVNWVYEAKNRVGLEQDFHIADGYYETNEFGEANEKLFRGYCMRILENYHKKETKAKIKRRKKKLGVD